MKIGIPKESHAGEKRVSMIPPNVKKLVSAGAEIEVESGLGQSIGVGDEEYEEAGAAVVSDRQALVSSSDVVLRLRKPPDEEVGWLKRGAIHVSFLDPFKEGELVDELAAAGVSAVSMEMVPRSTYAQKMDALSSQASLGGYMAVIVAARQLNRGLPMMTTPAGTLAPARVFVIGAGVAGLQAIATAKRLGARVEAFDTRPVVEEQVRSLGAKFVKIDLGETGQTEQGYAKELTPEQIEMQKKGMAKIISQSDVVITTAQLFGRPAPRIVDAAMLKGMKPGSVVVDMAVESGGNVEGSQVGEIVEKDGVKLVGLVNLPGELAADASQMYSSNLTNLLTDLWDEESKKLVLDLENEIVQGCLITHAGKVVNQMLLDIRAKQKEGN
ncbi:MAG TPA: Re/Si-specific NAD(P)(+) transhydrogenase subunit alpha [Acidobacteriota bacterium]|nr:Re/Si-specific NAD(P)(+) transhydrogenase subunit alpha [Acidobacteriota bacterium]